MPFTKEDIKKFAQPFVEAITKNKSENRRSEYPLDNALSGGSKAERVILQKSMKIATTEEKEFQRWNDDCLLMACMTGKRDERVVDVVKRLGIYKGRYEYFKNRSELAKAMDTATSGSGSEWIPTGWSTQLIDLYTLELKVAALFQRITMTTSPMEFYAKSSRAAARLGTEGGDPADSSVGTRKITLSAIKFIVDLPYTYELEEDVAFSLLPALRDDIVTSLAEAEENCTINGDTTAPHQDDDVTAANDVRKGFKGLRKLVISTATLDMATFTFENLVALKGKLGKYGSNPNLLAWIYGPKTEEKLLTIKDSNNNPIVSTVNTFGPEATAKTGIIRSILGSEAINSEYIREDLNALGRYDGTIITKTILICVFKPGFMFGDKRQLLVEQDKDVRNQTKWLVASNRLDFKDRLDAANNKLVSIGINIA